MIETTAEDSLCDALLMEYGLGDGDSIELDLEDARNRIRYHAQAIIDDLRDDGFDITEQDNPSTGET